MADTNVKIVLSADGSQVRDEIKLIDQELINLGQDIDLSQINTKGLIDPNQTQNINDPLQRRRDRLQSLIYKEFLLTRQSLQLLNRNTPNIIAALNNLSQTLISTNSQTSTNTSPPSSTDTTTSSTTTSSDTSVNPSTNTNSQGSPDRSVKATSEPASAVQTIMGRLSRLLAVASAFSFLQHAADMDYQRQKMAHQTYGSLISDNNYSDLAQRATDLGKNLGFDYNQVLPAIQANQQATGFGSLEQQKQDISAILSASRAYNIDLNNLSSVSGNMVGTGTFKAGEQQRFAAMLAKSIQENSMYGRENEQLSVLESINNNLASRNPTVTADTMASGMNLYNALVGLNYSMSGSRGGSLASRMIDIANSRDTGLDILAGLGTVYTGITGELELMKLSEQDPQQYYKQVYNTLKQTYGDNPNDELNATNVLMYKLTKDQGMSYHQAELAVEAIKSGDKFNTQAFTEEGQAEGQDEITERVERYKTSTLATLDAFNIKWDEVIASIGSKVNELKATAIDFLGDIDSHIANLKDTLSDIGDLIDEYIPSFEDIQTLLTETVNDIKDVTDSIQKTVEEIVKDLEKFYNNGGITGWLKNATKPEDDSGILGRVHKWLFDDGKHGGSGGSFGSPAEAANRYGGSGGSFGSPADVANRYGGSGGSFEDSKLYNFNRGLNSTIEDYYNNRPITNILDSLFFGKSEAAALHKEIKPENYFSPQQSFHINPSPLNFSSDYKEGQSITRKITDNTNKALLENTDALLENTKKLSSADSSGKTLSDETYLLNQKSNNLRLEHEGWVKVFDTISSAFTKVTKLIGDVSLTISKTSAHPTNSYTDSGSHSYRNTPYVK